MSFKNKLKSAGYELIAPGKQELLNDAKKLDKNINDISPIQKSINNLIEKINISRTGKERYVLEKQLEELQKLNILYKKYKSEKFTYNTKKEIKVLLNKISPQINLKENILEDDTLKLENIIENEKDILKDTLDIISPNTIRDTVEKYIDIKGELESIPKEKYQKFFDIATITYIDLLEKLDNNVKLSNKKQINFLSKNKGLYLDGDSIHIYIENLIKNLKNINLDFDFEIKLKKINYNEIYTVNLEKYKKELEKNNKIKQAKEKEIKERKILKEKEINYVLDEAINLIIELEGFIKISKWDNKQYSRGYGTKAPGKGLKITESEAKKELINEVIKIENYIEKYFPHVNKFQKIALISFFYNTGLSSRGKKNLIWRLKHMNEVVPGVGLIKPISVANMMLQYTKAGKLKKINNGLLERRKKEIDYFLKEEKKEIDYFLKTS